jgi:hypothetical protein
MKRITMTKYGFIRNEREDFHDDGNNFKGYATSPTSRLRISKLVSEGRAYLSADMNGNKLDYTEYSKLPHYKDATWNYNGIDMDSLTDEDLVNWYNACVEYEKEYIEAESKVVFPSIEEIRNQCFIINKIRQQEIKEVEELLQKASLNLFLKGTSDYELRSIRDYYKTLTSRFYNLDTYPQTIQYSNYGRNFVKDTNPDIQPNWYYKHLVEILEKYL